MKKEKKKEYQRYYLAYSAAVTGLFCVILLIFQKNGKSFIRGGDGLGQHYVALEYWGKYLRRIVKGILLEHRLNIPQWDLHIGYGADILTTLHYYVIGDPLNLLAVFVILILSPVESINKPLDDEEKKYYARVTHCIVALQVCVLIILFCLGVKDYFYAGYSSIVLVAVFMVMGKVIMKRYI